MITPLRPEVERRGFAPGSTRTSALVVLALSALALVGAGLHLMLQL